ncbi:MAG: Ig-like domain-containing protein [Elusimicrobia bacterium]|nr:Ig-like domain-containing protein [Elusimicrobiota bacterium]
MNASLQTKTASRFLLIALALGLCGGSALAQTCQTSAASWKNAAFAAQSAPFTAAFDATPNAAGVDAVTGLSYGPASGYAGLAAIVRFNTGGTIDARNGSAYAAAATVRYSPGASYHFRLVVDPAARRYSAYVTPPGGSEVRLGSNYAFRSEQANVSALNNLALNSSVGTHQICALAVTPSAITPPQPPPASGCQTSATSWKNSAFAAQSAPFTAAFDAVPNAAGVDAVTGLSYGPASGYAGLAAIVRFNTAGAIDARNGSAYAAAATVRYAPGAAYHFRLVVDPAARRYSAYVTPPGGSEVRLGANYAFRSEQASVSALNNLALNSSAGTHQVCAFATSAAPVTPVDTVPPVVAITAPAAGVTLSGSAALAAAASDNTGVVGVQFKLDGANLGAEDVSAPYGAAWNTAAAPDGGHVLTAVARDAAGNTAASPAVTVTVRNAVAPPPATGGADRFGIKKLYSTVSGGKEWISKWDNGAARTFASGSWDPYDPWFRGRGDATYAVDGQGLFKISGSVPRMYIYDQTYAQSWRNVEMTVYAMRVSDSGTAYGGIEGVARTNHSAYGASETVNTCDSRGVDARFRYDGHIDFEKETSHPNSVAVQNKPMWSGGMPKNVWIGYKLVVYDLPNGNVKLENYMDLTDGANGGTWTLVNSLEDNGANFGVGGTPCKSGINPALRLTNDDARPGSETGKPNIAVYWRSDNVGTNGLIYKKMSVREIAAP